MFNVIGNIDSSCIDHIDYDSETLDMSIGFKQGNIYAYKNVPNSVFEGLMNAKSKGKYFHENIKNKYNSTKTL